MPVNVSNVAEISFGTPTASWGTPAYLILDFGNQGGTNRISFALSGSPDATEVNREVVLAAGELDLDFASSASGLTDIIMAYILNEAFDEIVIGVALATGDPGSGFNQNLISGNGYSDATVAAGGFTATVT